MYRFSEILKCLIEEKGLTLRKIEAESGVYASKLSKYLRGSIPNVENAVTLAKYFECSLDYIFGIAETKQYKKINGFDLSGFVNKYQNLLKHNNTTNWLFCKKYGLSESSLRRWKYSGNLPNIESLINIATYLNSSIDYLIGVY